MQKRDWDYCHQRGQSGEAWDGRGDYMHYLRGKDIYDDRVAAMERTSGQYAHGGGGINFEPQVLRGIFGLILSAGAGLALFCVLQWVSVPHSAIIADWLSPIIMKIERWGSNDITPHDAWRHAQLNTALLNRSTEYWEASYLDWLLIAALGVLAWVCWIVSRYSITPALLLVVVPISTWMFISDGTTSAILPGTFEMSGVFVLGFLLLTMFNRFVLSRPIDQKQSSSSD